MTMMIFGGYTPKLLSFFDSIFIHRILESPVFLGTLGGLFLVILRVILEELWTKRTGFEKVLNGECIHGWRLVLSKSSICNESNHRIDGYWIVPPWQTLTADDNNSSTMSVFICTIHTRSDGLKLFQLRQQSLIIGDIFRVICQLEYDIVWSFHQATHLTRRVIALIFKKLTTGHYRVILVDIVTRTHRTITMESAKRYAYTRMCGLRQGTLEQGTLEAVFAHVMSVEGDDGLEIIGEFMLASYEILSKGEIGTFPVKPQPRKSMSFPLRHTSSLFIDRLVEYNPMTLNVILYYDIEQAGPDHRIFTLDEINGWRIDSVESWVDSLQSSAHTAHILAAAESLSRLSVPSECFRYFPPSLRHFNNLIFHHIGGAILYMTPADGVIQRLVSPPTLKRLAAEALMKSKQTLDHSLLKQLSGVDIFDGMTNKDEGTVPVMYF